MGRMAAGGSLATFAFFSAARSIAGSFFTTEPRLAVTRRESDARWNCNVFQHWPSWSGIFFWQGWALLWLLLLLLRFFVWFVCCVFVFVTAVACHEPDPFAIAVPSFGFTFRWEISSSRSPRLPPPVNQPDARWSPEWITRFESFSSTRKPRGGIAQRPVTGFLYDTSFFFLCRTKWAWSLIDNRNEK